MENELRAATLNDRILHFLGKRRGFLVEGDSMSPTLNDGDVVLIDPRGIAAKGDLVLAKHPYKSSVNILKRVTDVEPTGDLILTGDNPGASTDSRTFGAVAKDALIGIVVCRLK